jgi:hypothetical protein
VEQEALRHTNADLSLHAGKLGLIHDCGYACQDFGKEDCKSPVRRAERTGSSEMNQERRRKTGWFNYLMQYQLAERLSTPFVPLPFARRAHVFPAPMR